MNAIEFFSQPCLALPLTRTSAFDKDYKHFLGMKYTEYKELLESLKPDDEITQRIYDQRELSVKLVDSILRAIAHQFRGQPGRAYQCIKDALIELGQHLPHVIEYVDDRYPTMMYRMRVAGPEGGDFTKGDMFHMPFNIRHMVKRQRYSIPGLPCLYLGSSLYVCWEELGRPSFDTIYMVAIAPSPDSTTKILSFKWTPQSVSACLKSEDFVSRKGASDPSMIGRFVAVGLSWPLVAASSVRSLFQDAPFIAEYVIPQIILQCVTASHVLDGVEYFSGKVPVHTGSFLDIPYNAVYPVKSSKSNGHCKHLRKEFVMTEPVSWSMLANNPLDHSKFLPSQSRIHQKKLEIVRGHQVDYHTTIFGRMEHLLRRLPRKQY